jgi:xanthosine utilization system XapX-like protein
MKSILCVLGGIIIGIFFALLDFSFNITSVIILISCIFLWCIIVYSFIDN